MDATTTEQLNEITKAARILCGLRAHYVEEALRAELQPLLDTAIAQIARAEPAIGFAEDVPAFARAVAAHVAPLFAVRVVPVIQPEPDGAAEA